MSNAEIKGLTSMIQEEVKALRDKASTVNTSLRGTLAEAHNVLTYVEDMGAELRKAVSDLQGALGQHTNNPPAE